MPGKGYVDDRGRPMLGGMTGVRENGTAVDGGGARIFNLM